jgi:hypothetical protein
MMTDANARYNYAIDAAMETFNANMHLPGGARGALERAISTYIDRNLAAHINSGDKRNTSISSLASLHRQYIAMLEAHITTLNANPAYVVEQRVAPTIISHDVYNAIDNLAIHHGTSDYYKARKELVVAILEFAK